MIIALQYTHFFKISNISILRSDNSKLDITNQFEKNIYPYAENCTKNLNPV